MSGQELILEIQELRRDLQSETAKLREYGVAYAHAEYEYRKALRREAMRLHIEDGVIWSLCKDMAYGDSIVGEYRLKRDLARNTYETGKEVINTLKLALRLIDAQVEREWRS
jgi:hypothetical protein